MASFLKSILPRGSQIGLKRRNVLMMPVNRMSGYSDHVVPTNFQKKILVWTKFYPDAVSVPVIVRRGQLRNAIDLFRVRVNVLMMAFAAGAYAAMIYRGKQLRRDGDTALKRGLAHIQNLREEN